MNNNFRTFGVVGGDKRQLFLAKSVSDCCYEVFLGGFNKIKSHGGLNFATIKDTIKNSDAVIFPIPSVRADKSINTPFSDKNCFLDNDDINMLFEKPVFVSMKSRFLRAYPMLKDAAVYDYAARDDFAIMNALPTAEGAVETAMRNFEGTISQSKCLVVGFGRIGKILAKMLKSLNASVTVSARKAADRAYAEVLGYYSANTDTLRGVKGFDIVFNTVPSLIFDKKLLMNTDKDTLLIDLASLPGGIDFESAESFGIDAVRALSLPGKCAPKTAGEIIKATVFRIIEEVYG